MISTRLVRRRLTSQARGTDLLAALAKRAVRKIKAFKQETGEEIVFYQPGALKIARLPQHVEQLRSERWRAAGELRPGSRRSHPQRRAGSYLIMRSRQGPPAGMGISHNSTGASLSRPFGFQFQLGTQAVEIAPYGRHCECPTRTAERNATLPSLD
jgi:hypothetical protein